jgi:hypothetical protein
MYIPLVIIFRFFAQTYRMIILYILLIAYILAINFYAFLLVKTLRDKEREVEARRQGEPLTAFEQNPSTPSPPHSDKYVGKLLITGLLGGAITIYVCMFLLKFKRTELLLMVMMPLLGVLNIYLWVLLFKSGFHFFIIR